MPINKKIKGDLISLAKQGEFDFIVHGCNCHGIMGAGIAPQIASAFEGVLEADINYPIPLYSHERLGGYSYTYDTQYNVCVINAYTQFYTGRDARYDALREVFELLNHDISNHAPDTIVGIPAIGCGIGGLDVNAVEHIINVATPDINIVWVDYDGQ